MHRYRKQNGSILVMTALLLTVMLGVTALAVDVGSLYDTRNRMAAAADAAARTAALELKSATGCSGNCGRLTNFGQDATKQGGFTNGTNGVSVTINHPPTRGPFTADVAYVEAIVTQSVPTHFMRLFGRTALQVGARAVAGGLTAPPCIVALGDGNPATTAVTLTGSTNLAVPGCTVYVNGSLTNTGGAGITATPGGVVYVEGTVSRPSGISPAAQAGSIADPFASVAQPFNSASLTSNPCTKPVGTVIQGYVLRSQSQVTNAVAPQPGIYCGGLKWSAGGAGALANDGMYIMYGGGFVEQSTGHLTGTGVTIFNTGSNVTGSIVTGQTAAQIVIIGGSVSVDLIAPTSGSYTGILFFQDRLITMPQPTFQIIGGSPNVNLTGTLYAANGAVAYAGVSGGVASAYTFIVARTIGFNGSTVLHNNASGLTGGVFQSGKMAE